MIGILFDWFAGTLTYYKDGICLGIAFTGLQDIHDEIYPVVSSTAAKTEMTLGVTLRGFNDLQDRCRTTIMTSLKYDCDIDKLPLPTRLKDFLKEAKFSTRALSQCTESLMDDCSDELSDEVESTYL